MVAARRHPPPSQCMSACPVFFCCTSPVSAFLSLGCSWSWLYGWVFIVLLTCSPADLEIRCSQSSLDVPRYV